MAGHPLKPKQYQRRSVTAMILYVLAMVLVWPLVRSAPNLPLKLLLVAAPVLPMLYVIRLMALRVMHSDELQQRTHLIALGAATTVVGALSLIGGFLAAGHVVPLDGTVLIWVFPVLLAVYGMTRWWVITRHYGGTMACDDEEGGMSMIQRLLLVTGVMGFLALATWWSGKLDATSLGMFCGIGAALLVFWVIALVRRRGSAS